MCIVLYVSFGRTVSYTVIAQCHFVTGGNSGNKGGNGGNEGGNSGNEGGNSDNEFPLVEDLLED